MSIFEKNRWEIWNQTQHPYKHTLSDFGYTNPSMPGVNDVASAIDWIMAVLYPNTKPSVDTVADLPSSGNTINDYRVVRDDGDGKAAGYRWEQRPGEGSPSWHKIYDMDWGQDSVLAAWQELTQDYYVWRDGRDDIDGNGDPVTGIYAGQTIYGGKSADTNLTLVPNFLYDGGYVQFDGDVRPAANDTYIFGDGDYAFKSAYFTEIVQIDTLQLYPGGIQDSSGTIDFAGTNIVTAGNITGGSYSASEGDFGTLHLEAGIITDSSGNIDFQGIDINGIVDLQGESFSATTNGTDFIIYSSTGIVSTTGGIDFNGANLTTVGDIGAEDIVCSQITAGNLQINSNAITAQNTDGWLYLTPNGTGKTLAVGDFETTNAIINGTLDTLGISTFMGVQINTNTISTTSGDMTLDPQGGDVFVDGNVRPQTDNTFVLGATNLRWANLYLSGGIGDGTNFTQMDALMGIRNIMFRDAGQTTPVQNGDALFYNSASGTWLASKPDTEINHADLSGLTTGDAGHTQFALLAGRPGGQALIGGTASGNNLDLESTSNGSKGAVRVKDNFLAFTNASYSGGWSGIDIGGVSNYFRNIYSKGEHIGLRLENLTVSTLPSSSAQNAGRVMFATDNGKAYIDDGTSVKVLGVAKYQSDVAFDGIVTQKDVTVSASVGDARTCLWQLRDNANDYEIIFTSIKATSASNVRITTNIPLSSGSYRLIGLE